MVDEWCNKHPQLPYVVFICTQPGKCSRMNEKCVFAKLRSYDGFQSVIDETGASEVPGWLGSDIDFLSQTPR